MLSHKLEKTVFQHSNIFLQNGTTFITVTNRSRNFIKIKDFIEILKENIDVLRPSVCNYNYVKTKSMNIVKTLL